MITFNEKSIVISQGSQNNVFYIIAKGSVVASVNGKSVLLKKGDIVGIFDITLPIHTCSYVAAEEVVLMPYEFTDTFSFLDILDKNTDLRKLFILSFCRNIVLLIKECQNNHSESIELSKFITDLVENYHSTCRTLGLLCKSLAFMENMDEDILEDHIPFYFEEYFSSIRKMIAETTSAIPANFVYGFLTRSQDDISFILDLSDKFAENQTKFSSYIINEDYLDIFDLFCDLYFRAKANNIKTEIIEESINNMVDKLRSLSFINQELVETRIDIFKKKLLTIATPQPISKEDEDIHAELAGSLDTILSYADTMNVTAAEFKKYLDIYKQLPDKTAMDREVDSIRKHLTKLFYLIYNETIQEHLQGKPLPTVVQMFLNYGYMDPELCGYHNAVELYKITEEFHGLKEQGIYTFYEWIKEVYDGNKQPSRNEFEQDYAAYVRNLKREGKITKEVEASMATDSMAKVMYELQNMFTQVNKITFGRVLSYCPIMVEENIIKPLRDMLITPVKIIEQYNKIAEIDYSAFYHEILFEDPKVNVKETVYVDIKPDIILMPNIGTKGILWQEIEGMHRTTPGRMMISAFHMENLEKTFIRMVGEFRWEMCKRTMGARWNDFSIHSLTGDYCDYAQFFAKNRELSYDAKEKIKTTLKRCKNNYKELFILDYMTYIMYESTGSCRLNRVVRGILFRHCPFCQSIQTSLQGNGAFQDILDKHRIKNAQAIHRLNQIQLKYQNARTAFPDELANQKELISR